VSAELELTSWRRMISELYVAVRAEEDPQRGHALWRHGRDQQALKRRLPIGEMRTFRLTSEAQY
jgi:hypothetical protein